MARLIAVMGTLSRDRDTVTALHLVFTLAAFAVTLADLREAQHRLSQARAARHAAGQLRTWTPPTGAGPRPSPATRGTRPPMPDPVADRRGRQR